MMKEAGLQINTGADDLIFVMNKLSQLNNKNEPHFPLVGRLDLNKIAAVGHSSGGANATLACELSERFKACLSLEGQLPPIAAFPTNPEGKFFTQPVLLLEVDHSGQRRGFNDAQNDEYLKKKQEQLEQCPAGSYDVVLKSEGLVHGSFSDFPLLIAYGRVKETKFALDNLRLIESYVLAFLDKNLKSAKEPLLGSGTSHPDALVKPYGGSPTLLALSRFQKDGVLNNFNSESIDRRQRYSKLDFSGTRRVRIIKNPDPKHFGIVSGLAVIRPERALGFHNLAGKCAEQYWNRCWIPA